MKVTTYNGVHIYVDREGEFYCNTDTNSDEKYYATFKSSSLASIKKAIDYFSTEFEPYDIYNISDGKLTKVTVTSKVGNRLFVNSKPIDQLRGGFFPLDIENSEYWAKINELTSEVSKQSQIIDSAYAARRQANAELQDIVKHVPKL